MNFPDLLQPIDVFSAKSSNRVFMAPLTRARADENHVPNELMAEYYSQRAGGGLIIAEATMVMEGNSAFTAEPGIYNATQAAAWKTVTDAVHERGGRIALQLWHGGRACHPLLNNGQSPVAPSPIAITGDQIRTPQGKKDYVVPEELKDSDIPDIIDGFRKAASYAKDAGFDGVEIHGANGYLLDEFLRDGANQRPGPYGGPIENRARLMFEVIEATASVWGIENVGLRISPLNSYNSMIDSDPYNLTAYIASKADEIGLGYLHVMRSDFLGQQTGNIMPIARENYRGVLIGNMGYTAAEANREIEKGNLDAVAFGTPFLANPDLPERFARGAKLNEPNPATFYTPGPEGYIDYPALPETER